MGEAAKAGNHIPVPTDEVGGAGIAEALEERQGCLLHRQVFRVHQRPQPELPPRLLWLRLQPAPLHRLQTLSQSLGIAREGHGVVAPDLAGELIEQQHQRQAPGGFRAPGVELTGEGLTDANLSGLAWHIRGITALAIAFVVVGALIRLGGLG